MKIFRQILFFTFGFSQTRYPILCTIEQFKRETQIPDNQFLIKCKLHYYNGNCIVTFRDERTRKLFESMFVNLFLFSNTNHFPNDLNAKRFFQKRPLALVRTRTECKQNIFRSPKTRTRTKKICVFFHSWPHAWSPSNWLYKG